MRKKLLLWMILLVFIFTLPGCSKNTAATVRKLYNYKNSDVTRIEFVNQGIRTQKQPLIVEDKKKIEEFLGYLDDCKLKGAGEKDAKMGWTYQAALYNNDKQIVLITFGNPILLSTDNYSTHDYFFPVENEITSKQLDKFLGSVNSAWVPTTGDPNQGMQ